MKPSSHDLIFSKSYSKIFNSTSLADTGKDDAKRGENLEKLQQGEEVDIDLNDPEVQAAATKIQASFRGHKVREEAQTLRGHKAKKKRAQQLKDQISRESIGSPTHLETKPTDESIDIDLNDPEVGAAALKIQASFRGHKARTEVEKIKSSEAVASPTQDSTENEEKEAAEQPVAEEDQPSEGERQSL